MRRYAFALVTLVFFSTTLSLSPTRANAVVVLTAPVDAPVLDPFRLPQGPYGPGNRGIEYDTEVGDVVRAAAGGIVVFAGSVAGTLHVTVDHGAGLLSSYSFLDRVLVGVGDAVGRGDPVGLAGDTVHFGVRIDGEYVDPASLMGTVVVRVRLVAGEGDRLGVTPTARSVPVAPVRFTRNGPGIARSVPAAPVAPATRGPGLPWYRLLLGRAAAPTGVNE